MSKTEAAYKATEIIHRLGGAREIADYLQLAESTVWNWMSTGIPAVHHFSLRERAKKLNRTITWPELAMAATKRRKNDARAPSIGKA